MRERLLKLAATGPRGQQMPQHHGVLAPGKKYMTVTPIGTPKLPNAKLPASQESVLAKLKLEATNKAEAELAGEKHKLLHGLPLLAGKGAIVGLCAVAASLLTESGKEGIKKLLMPKPSLAKNVRHAMGQAAGYGLGGLALGAGVGLAGAGLNAATEPHYKEKHYTTMLKENPHLKHEDAATVRKSFDTLWHFNRDMASNPVTSGSFVRRAVAFKDEGIGPNDVKLLTDIRKNMSSIKSDSFLDKARAMANFGPKSDN